MTGRAGAGERSFLSARTSPVRRHICRRGSLRFLWRHIPFRLNQSSWPSNVCDLAHWGSWGGVFEVCAIWIKRYALQQDSCLEYGIPWARTPSVPLGTYEKRTHVYQSANMCFECCSVLYFLLAWDGSRFQKWLSYPLKISTNLFMGLFSVKYFL